MRQRSSRKDRRPGAVNSTFVRDYPPGANVAPHSHATDQLVYASRGIVQIVSAQTLWIIPPLFGLWVPAGTVHRLHMPQSVDLRTLYLRPKLAKLGGLCKVLHIAPLLRELILEVIRRKEVRAGDQTGLALRTLLVAQLERAALVPVSLCLPRDSRAFAVASRVMQDLGARCTLPPLCASAGIGVRTLERVFVREVGMPFEAWRRQARLMKGIELLAQGRRIKEVAVLVGYQQPHTFVSIFRQTFGSTPRVWAAALIGDSPTPDLL